MNVIKQHMFEVICGVVIVAALSTYFLWSSWDANAAEGGKTRLGAGYTKANQLAGASQSVAGTNYKFNGPASPQAVKFAKEVYDSLKKSAEAIESFESQGNSSNRINASGVPQLPVLNENKGMVWEPQPGLLPKTITTGQSPADPGVFQSAYGRTVNVFLTVLNGGMPPVASDLDGAGKPPVGGRRGGPLGGPLGMGGGGPAPVVDPAVQRAALKKAAMEQYNKIRIYADANSFYIEPWAALDTAPDPTQIFHGFVYTWIQADIVNAINAVNGKGFVASSPIKRIETIAIGEKADGNTAIGTPAFVPTSGGTMGGGPVAAPAAAATPGVNNSGVLFISMATGAVVLEPGSTAANQAKADGFKRSPTGRGVSDVYDVTHVRVVLHMTPDAINRFLVELYKQNNAYTQINFSMQAVDPLDCAANGFIYGNVPTVRAEFVFEAVFYRSWLEKLMPEAIKSNIGIAKPATPAPTPAPTP